MDVKLNPCPYCGSKAEILTDWSNDDEEYLIHCTNKQCGRVTPYWSSSLGRSIMEWNAMVKDNGHYQSHYQSHTRSQTMQPQIDDEAMYTVKQAAGIAGYSINTILYWMRDKQLAYHRGPKGAWLINGLDLRVALAARRR